MGVLDDLDLTKKLSREEEAEGLERAQTRLTQLRLTLGGLIGKGELGPPVCAVFEGHDASGKGGAIKRLVGRLDPRHVRVVQFAAPTHDEKRHHFLWRFWPSLPGWGGMAVFDRSWYGRVLVERVEGFATREQWLRAYDEINGFERTLADEGMILVKFWMHISPEEQLKRFEKREKDPLKSWKLTDEDWRNREKRPQYDRGHGRPHQCRAAREVASDPGRLEALCARRGDRHGDRGDRGRHAPPRHAGSGPDRKLTIAPP
jgi:AMP-polyphosphate phosphotransferase